MANYVILVGQLVQSCHAASLMRSDQHLIYTFDSIGGVGAVKDEVDETSIGADADHKTVRIDSMGTIYNQKNGYEISTGDQLACSPACGSDEECFYGECEVKCKGSDNEDCHLCWYQGECTSLSARHGTNVDQQECEAFPGTWCGEVACSASDTIELSADCRCALDSSTNECVSGKFCWADNTCNDAPKASPVNCVMGEWSSWSACSVTCGEGTKSLQECIHTSSRWRELR